jgi:hypothetical protein
MDGAVDDDRFKWRERITSTPRPRDPASPGAALAFPPVTNGLDYLVSVIDHLALDESGNKPEPRHLKYAVLHLQAAAEVLLKARLEREHWSLVAEKITDKKLSRVKFERGDFASVTPGEAVRRVRDIVGFEITANEERSLDTLAKARNSLQHYGLTETYEAVEALTAKVLDFLIRFLDESLFPDPLTANDEDLQDIHYVRAGANRLHTYVDQRLARIGPTLAGLEERTVQCPRCFQETLVVEVDRTAKPPLMPRCRFCHADWLPFALAHEYNAVHHRGLFSDNIPVCPRCASARAVVRHVFRACDRQQPQPTDDSSHPIYHSVTFCFECAAPVPGPASADPAIWPAPETE